MISPETYAELRKFVRENGAPPEDEPEEMEGMPPDPKGAVEIEVKSEPMGGKSVCPTCGHPIP